MTLQSVSSVLRPGMLRFAVPHRPSCRRLQSVACASPVSQISSWNPRLPFGPSIELDGQQLDPDTVINLLSGVATAERVQRISQVVPERTYNVLPVVEGLYDMGNLAAVSRSADAMGYGALHVISNGAKYKKSQRTSAGADKWLHVTMHEETSSCLASLKAAGFQVVVTHLGPSSISITDVDWTRPTAVVLGNEAAGVSPEAVAAADHCAIIPMAGFVESFNISVAAALVLYEARRQRQERLGSSGDLSPEEQQALTAHLLVRAQRHSESILRELLSRPPPVWQAHHFKQRKNESGAKNASTDKLQQLGQLEAAESNGNDDREVAAPEALVSKL